MSLPVSLLMAVLLAAITAAAAGPALRRLPPPRDHTDPLPPWHGLPTGRWLAAVAIASFASAVVGLLLAPPPTAPLWLVWSGPVVLLIAIDAATTWLPLSLSRVCAALLLIATGVAWALGMPAIRLVVIAIAAIVTFGIFHLVWLVSRGGLGYGDVRLAPMVAVMAGAVSISTISAALILGSLIGVGYGIGHRARGHRAAFAYGPALWAGPGAALVVMWAIQALMR